MTEIPEVPAAELDDSALVLDVREPDEFAAGHTPGAVSIPLGELRARLDELPAVDEDEELPVICRSGARSAQAVAFLIEQGLRAVNVAGGTAGWFDAGKPLLSETGEEPAVIAHAGQVRPL